MFPGHGWSLKITPIFSTSNTIVQVLMLAASSLELLSSIVMINIASLITVAGGGLILLSCQSELATLWTRYSFACSGCVAWGCCCGALNSACGSLAGSLVARYGGDLVNMHGSGITLAGVLATGMALLLEVMISKSFGSAALYWTAVLLGLCCIVGVVALSRSGALKPWHRGEGEELSIEVSDIGVPKTAARETPSATGAPSLLSAIRRGWQQELNVFVVFVQTFVVFPGVMLQWKPNVLQGSFVLVMIGAFQIGEVLGRFSFPLLLGPQGRHVWKLVFLRFFVLLPSFWAWQQPDGMFGDIVWEAISMALLGWSQGYLTSLIFLRGMTECLPSDTEALGRFLPLVLNFGIVAGSYLSDYIIARNAVESKEL